ncbi:hypothetical protein [Gordonia alkaliphila]|uniref:Ribbon-helix-helix protein CopG domain-containing protein n=1 Tax=Gordonia alkaliphila TaxID=1053547 RepID=A0ABP8YZE9_9ACTN
MSVLDSRQVVPLTSAELDQLRQAAGARGISAGLFGRGLMRFALEHADRLDAAMERESEEAAARVSAGARRAIAQRWAK